MIFLRRLVIKDFKALHSIDLAFPRQATILIEGWNEAGKSSLFEAIHVALYGTPLITEETGGVGRGKLESVIAYDKQQTVITVELEVGSDDPDNRAPMTNLLVQRSIKRNGNNTAHLTVTYSGNLPEHITSISAVSSRVLQELGHLTSEALLNSCFVEQKQLGRLEDMTAESRRNALGHLLNLTRFERLVKQNKITGEEREELKRAEQLLSIAQHHATTPDLRAELVAATSAVDLAEQLAARGEHTRAARRHQEISTRLSALTTERESLRARQEHIAQLTAAQQTLDQLIHLLNEMQRLRQAERQIRAEHSEIEQQKLEKLPLLQQRQLHLEELAQLHEEIHTTREAQQQLAHELSKARLAISEIDARQQALHELTSEIAVAQTDLDSLATEIDSEETSVAEEEATLNQRYQQIERLGEAITRSGQIMQRLEKADAAQQRIAALADQQAKLSARIAAIDQQLEALGRSEPQPAYSDSSSQGYLAEIERVALERWLQGAEDAAHRAQLTAQVTAAQAEKDRQIAAIAAANNMLVQARARTTTMLAGAGAALIVGAILIAAHQWWGAIAWLGMLALVVSAVSARRLVADATRHRVAADSAHRLADESLRQVAADLRAWENLGGGARQQHSAAAQLDEHRLSVPRDVDEARRRLAALPARDASLDLATLRKDWETAQAAQEARERTMTELRLERQVVASHQTEIARVDAVDSELAKLIPALTAEKTAVWEQITAQAAALGISPGQADWGVARDIVEESLRTIAARQARLPLRREQCANMLLAVSHRSAQADEMRAWLASHPRDVAQQTLESLLESDARLTAHTTALQDQITSTCNSLGIGAHPQEAQQALGKTLADLDALTTQGVRRSEPTMQLVALRDQHERVRLRLQAIWEHLHQAVPELSLPSSITEDTREREVQELAERLSAILIEQDADGVTQRISEIDQEIGKFAQEERTLASTMAELEGRMVDMVPAPPHEHYGLLDTSSDALVTARQRQEDARVALQAHERQLETMARQMGIPTFNLIDLQAQTAQVMALRQTIRVKEVALEMIEVARKRMIAKVLPTTRANLNMLLPLLTLDRYRDCEITEDYKLRIWDTAARRYVAKNIFSGGTRDQFSLALRLAFALATLPEQLGTTPGFIFLDEPLSSFDGPRSEALVNLLTRGQIHASFPQIFVISHAITFDRRAFTHHLRLEHGAIAASTLPSTPSSSMVQVLSVEE